MGKAPCVKTNAALTGIKRLPDIMACRRNLPRKVNRCQRKSFKKILVMQLFLL
ncbi:hypothetical protein DVU_2709 [Nitratidesulfovibrio vulgaris str. Hildenborough]|uniref:Uncharacterized protein n=1 Tax=Nitratidesulfovibrio vulgaris (strain ATCC 29579 / DSM 644 / CCUG 34227 / NCIMB 8303 / VKM B-1760 / Hildenborough) TaxID=882 RepID=Q727Z5_NITV2|nr:hypothetical protein DVU_2709 [Nitratidesulfovibrio vulgaris str. Hildenborough]